jgi:hypothetical protein
MSTRTFKTKLADWQVLVDNLTPHLTDMPQLAADHAALSDVVAHARTLESQQEIQKGQLRDTNQQRKVMAAQGRDLEVRLAAGLTSAFGPQSEQLIQFGLKPRARIVRRPRQAIADKAEQAAEKAAKANATAIAAAALKAARKDLAKAAVL